MIGKFMPAGYKAWTREMLRLTGSRHTPEVFADRAFIISILVGLVGGLFAVKLFAFIALAAGIAMFVLMHGFLALAVDRRTRFVESVLPDALQLMAANSRAGHIPSRALLLSARKEFGPLSQAIKLAGKEMMTGKSMEESFALIPRLIKSDVLEKTVKLILEGARGGGQFAQLLEENAESVRRTQAIQKEVRASIMMYTIFIGFAGVIAAPILYSLSTFLVGTLGSIGGTTLPDTAAAGIKFGKFGKLDVSEEFLTWFSLAAILITTSFSSLILGLISTGKEKGGIKYLPFFVLLALGIFFLAGILIHSLFGGIAAR